MKRLGILALVSVCSLSFGIEDRDRLFRMNSKVGQQSVASCTIYASASDSVSAVITKDLGGIIVVSDRRDLMISKGDLRTMRDKVRSQSTKTELTNIQTLGAVAYQISVNGKWVSFHEEGAGYNKVNQSAEAKAIRELLRHACR